MGSPATILKSGAQVTTQGGKQVIIRNTAGGTAQPQIVTLVKTAKGVTVAVSI